MSQPLIIMASTIGAFTLLGFMFNRSIKKHEANKPLKSKKKGRTKYMPQSKNFSK